MLDDGRLKGHSQLVPQRIEPALAQQLEYLLLPEIGVFLVGRVADGDLVREVEALVDQVSHKTIQELFVVVLGECVV